jgi:hypothetical protein
MINTTPIKKYLNDPIQNYQLVPIKYTKEEQYLIENLDINRFMSFDHYGNKSNIDNQKLNTFLNDIGSNKDIDLKILHNLIMKLLAKITRAFGTDYIWITIRTTLKSKLFDIRRWHRDGSIFDYPHYSFITTLIGPGTLFIKDTKEISKLYDKNNLEINNALKKSDNKQSYNAFDDDLSIRYRKKLANALKKFNYKQSKNNQGLIFKRGIDGLLHSEPKKDVPRFFILIMPDIYIYIYIYIDIFDLNKIIQLNKS